MNVTAALTDTVLIELLDKLVGGGETVVSAAPVRLAAPGRPIPLDVRVSAPATGTDLPVVLFSHGNGWSLDGYAPLTAFWASRGFVVVQPTHLDSRRNAIGFDDPRFGDIWIERYRDLRRILDQLAAIESAVPGLRGRVDHDRIAAAGHSWGAQTVQMTLGARIMESTGQPGVDWRDTRVRAGVLLAATGIGRAELTPFAREKLPFMDPSFAEMTTPALVIAGDHDQSAMSTRGPDWFTDAYTQSPGATDLLTLFGAEHSLGGIANYEAAETTDESPERVAVLQRLTTAYLRSALDDTDNGWDAARSIIADRANAVGRIDSK